MSVGFQPPISPAIGLSRRLAVWASQHVFALPPYAWYGALGLSLASACFLAMVGMGPWWLSALALLPAAVVAAPTITWWNLGRRDRKGRLIVAVARFKQRSGAGPELAAVHAQVLEREVMRNTALATGVHLRPLKHPLDEAQARRLLQRSAVRVVICGETTAAWDKARWDAWMMTRWPQAEGRFDQGIFGRPFVAMLKSTRTRGDRAPLGTDAEQLISTLTAAEFPAGHAQAIVATLLALVEGVEASRQADAMLDHMPAEVRAVRENNRTLDYLEDGGEPLEAARRLERAVDNGANHIWLWTQCLTYLTLAEQKDSNVSLDERRRVAGKALAAAPDDPVANINMGIALLGTAHTQEGIEYLDQALRHGGRHHRPLIYEMLHEGYRDLGDDEAARDALARAWARTRIGRWHLRRRFQRDAIDVGARGPG